MADVASQENQPMRQIGPFFRREAGTYFLFNLDDVRIRLLPLIMPAQPARHALDMRIDRKSRLIEGISEHYICGLASHTRKSDQFFARAWDNAMKALDQLI